MNIHKAGENKFEMNVVSCGCKHNRDHFQMVLYHLLDAECDLYNVAVLKTNTFRNV